MREKQQYYENIKHQEYLQQQEEERKSSGRLAHLLFDLSKSCASNHLQNAASFSSGNYRNNRRGNYRRGRVIKNNKKSYDYYVGSQEFDDSHQNPINFQYFDSNLTNYYQDNQNNDIEDGNYSDVSLIHETIANNQEVSEKDEIINVLFPPKAAVKRRRSF